MRNLLLSTLLFAGLAASTAYAAGKDMKEAELKSLLEGGKTLQLGGKGLGYTGTLDLAADGTGKGAAQPDCQSAWNVGSDAVLVVMDFIPRR